MLGSNQRPLPCEGSAIGCWRFLELAKCLQIAIFPRYHFSQYSRRFTWVAARLLHNSAVPRYLGLHQRLMLIAATSVVVLRTGVMPRWLALAGFVAALFALLRFLIPLGGILGLVWVLVVSVFLLMGSAGRSVRRFTAVGP
jgi:hypothetical protein